MADEKAGDSSLYTWGKATLLGIWHTTGIPGVWETGRKAGKESDDQYLRDKKAGKDPSAVWALARGVGKGVGTFAKGMFVDLYATYGKTYAVLPTAEELAGHWSGGEFVATEFHLSKDVLDAADAPFEGCDPETVQQVKSSIRTETDNPTPKDLTIDLHARGGATGTADLNVHVPDDDVAALLFTKIKLTQGMSYKYSDGQITIERRIGTDADGAFAIRLVGKVQRSGDAWLLGGAWTLTGQDKARTMFLVKGTWSGKKPVSRE